jgi:DNA-directed RNA polymerase subunit RPC12/RpoP
MTWKSLACQTCGATLNPSGQQNLVKCDYCGTELTVLVAERIEVRREATIPEAILIAEPLPAPRQPEAPSPPPQEPSRAESESQHVPFWARYLINRTIREFFRRW